MTGQVLDEVRAWLGRFISVQNTEDLDILTLWAAHTHVTHLTYTSPRILISSPMPGSGKTTVLEHMHRLCFNPVQAASISSEALLSHLASAGRTILIDEADRSLNRDNPLNASFLAILNSGYKHGGSRPTLQPTAEGRWEPVELSTYAPVAIAGNNPNLPDDTLSRCIRIMLYPDINGTVEDSDWETIDQHAQQLGNKLAAWTASVEDKIRQRPELPDQLKGRDKERWRPLKRIANAAQGSWPGLVDELALEDHQELISSREAGLVMEKPHIILLRHLAEGFADQTFIRTSDAVNWLISEHPEVWGAESSFGKPLTPQRFGRMLSSNFGLKSGNRDAEGIRGYTLHQLEPAFSSLGITLGSSDTPAKQSANTDKPPKLTDELGGIGSKSVLAAPNRGTQQTDKPAPGCRLHPGNLVGCHTCDEKAGRRND